MIFGGKTGIYWIYHPPRMPVTSRIITFLVSLETFIWGAGRPKVQNCCFSKINSYWWWRMTSKQDTQCIGEKHGSKNNTLALMMKCCMLIRFCEPATLTAARRKRCAMEILTINCVQTTVNKNDHWLTAETYILSNTIYIYIYIDTVYTCVIMCVTCVSGGLRTLTRRRRRCLVCVELLLLGSGSRLVNGLVALGWRRETTRIRKRKKIRHLAMKWDYVCSFALHVLW